MLKKSFFGLSEPRFYYKSLSDPMPNQVIIHNPKSITLHIKEELSKKSSGGIKIGEKVKTGRKIYLSNTSENYTVSSITGIIDSITPITSIYGASHTAISIKTSNHEEIDEDFKKISSEPNISNMANFLASSPGEPPFWRLLDKNNPVDKIIIYGGDADFLIDNTLRIILEKSNNINEGIKILKAATGIEDITLVVPEETVQNYSGYLEAKIKMVSSQYPYSNPLMITYMVNGSLPGPKGINSTRLCFLRFEAVAMIGQAFKNNVIPTKKRVAIIDKNGKKHLVNVCIGTHIDEVFKNLNISVHNQDKIIFGGPMTGSAIYSENHPILPDTDLILIQDKDVISHYSDYPCTNCGECIRICPANVPVNLLVRFLEAGRYEEAADSYDLYSCVECGLCSYVCVSKIPVFQHIKLAKYELNRTGYAEEMNE